MNDCITVVGLDVHKKTIVAAILPRGADRVSDISTIENNPKAVKKLARRAASRGPVEFIYEAGPCGYQVQRQLADMGHRCVVIAPSLTPVRPGDRVKTDRRDAEKLARLHRAGELTVIRIPSREEEAARDLVRVREDVLADRLRARNRLSKFLLRQGRVFSQTKSWGKAYTEWLRTQRFDFKALQQSFEAYLRAVEETQARQEGLEVQLADLAQSQMYRTPVAHLRCLKGIDTLSAMTLLVETQDFRRFAKASSYMGFTGLVPSEYSSGSSIRRGGITKAGNAHIRRILVEAAWCNRHRNVVSLALAKRRKGCPPKTLAIARKAQDRLSRKYWRMVSKGKAHTVTVAAVARELAGFVWAIARHFPEPATTS